jgi:hypothetical protein
LFLPLGGSGKNFTSHGNQEINIFSRENWAVMEKSKKRRDEKK